MLNRKYELKCGEGFSPFLLVFEFLPANPCLNQRDQIKWLLRTNQYLLKGYQMQMPSKAGKVIQHYSALNIKFLSIRNRNKTLL